jgi:hypothetical protein
MIRKHCCANAVDAARDEREAAADLPAASKRRRRT